MIAVADTGPLLAQAKINALDLLAQVFQQVVASPIVFTEAVTAGLAQNAPDAHTLNVALDWLLVDDMEARRAALTNLAAARVPTGVKGTLSVIVTAHQQKIIPRTQAIDLVNALKTRPDIWISKSLCDQVIHTLQTSPL